MPNHRFFIVQCNRKQYETNISTRNLLYSYLESYSDRQALNEARRAQQPKLYDNNDEDNSLRVKNKNFLFQKLSLIDYTVYIRGKGYRYDERKLEYPQRYLTKIFNKQ